MTAAEVMAELEAKGSAATTKTLLRHGAREPLFGVKVADLKVLQKRIKTNHPLALELYATGNSDAMYLAGLVADPRAATKAELNRWVKAAYWPWLSEYAVPWVASESRYAVELATAWMDARPESTRAAGWATYSSHVSVTPDDALDLDQIAGLLDRVRRDIHGAANRVRYTMNGFVIAVGGCVRPLNAAAKAAATAIGPVTVDVGDTACRVPDALGHIAALEARGTLGRKRKSARC
jgi:3-methyladenine DNA glycosylase AlkD